MSKYFSLFTTESQYQAAKNTLDSPNVSLIETTGNLHYLKFYKKELMDAPLGSIVMASVADGTLFYIDDSDYNSTDYPISDYEPIAVCIYNRENRSDDKAVFLSTRWLNTSSQFIPSRAQFTLYNKSAVIEYCTDKITPGYTLYKNMVNGGLDIHSNAVCFEIAQNASTTGTSTGDWFCPSYYDMSKIASLNSTPKLSQIFTNIKNIAGTSFLSNDNAEMGLCYNDNSNCYKIYYYNGTYNFSTASSANVLSLRPVFYAGPEEL